ncbi:MAG: RNA polymerase sigma factor [Planctomycetaceae bacterium]
MARPAHAADTRTDEELIRRISAHDDDQAFETLVHRYEHELYGYLRRYLGDADLAEDVFQATFLRIHQKSDHFVEGNRFRPWLYAVATNQAIDARRRNHRHRMTSLDRRPDASPEAGSLAETIVARGRTSAELMQHAETVAWVLKAVAALPEPLRSTLDLVYRQGLKQREVASRLGIPVGTVKSRINTALHRLHASCARAV